MSWSVTMFGYPENIVKALDEESEKMRGESKREFDAALPAIKSLVMENFSNVEGCAVPVISLIASGHGYVQEGRDQYRNLHIKIEPCAGKIV